MKKRDGDTETRQHGDKNLRVAALPRPQVPLITLLTDFGNSDYFVGAVKGAILTVNPAARIVDITHEIPAHDIETGAFTLMAVSPSFPAGTIHVAVVDPGVGSPRRPILIRVGGQYLVGPDNGIFSYVSDSNDATPEVFHLDRPEYFSQPVSPTFNGRDLFAPVAASLSNGVEPEKLGTRVTDYVRLPPLKPIVSRNGEIKARIIHIDRFGNCVTNITSADLTAKMIAAGAVLRIKGKTVKSFRDYFAQESGGREKLFAVWGSAGFLEIAVANESAAMLLKAKRGDSVTVSTIIMRR